MNRWIALGALLAMTSGCGDGGGGGGGGGTDPSTSASSVTAAATNGTSASSKAASSATTASTASTTSGASSTGAGNAAPVSIVWTDVVIATDCFLFSDPEILGTSATMSSSGAERELAFGGTGQSYTGNDDGGSLTLTGAHTADYDGDTWQFTETFSGSMSGEVFSGTWSYTECNMTASPATCPADGGCSGTAHFVISGGAP